MIKAIILAAAVPFMTQHRAVAPSTMVSTNFYGSVTGIVDQAYIEAHGGGGGGGGGVNTNEVTRIANQVVTNQVEAGYLCTKAAADATYFKASDTSKHYELTANAYGELRYTSSSEDGVSFYMLNPLYPKAYGALWIGGDSNLTVCNEDGDGAMYNDDGSVMIFKNKSYATAKRVYLPYKDGTVALIGESYTKAQADGLLGNKANSSDVYTKTETVSLLGDYVPNTRTVNNKPLTSNITLSASDVGAPTTANAILVGQNARNKSFSIGNGSFGNTAVDATGVTITGASRLGGIGGGVSLSGNGMVVTPMTIVSTNEYQNGVESQYGPGYITVGPRITCKTLILPEKNGTLATTDDITQLPNNAVVLTNGQVKTVSGTALSAHDIGAPTTNELENTKAIVYTWENFLDGSNVVFSITNYISGSYNLNTAKFRILEMTNGVYREVYNSREEIVMHLDDFKTNDFRVATNQVITSVDAKIAGKADKAWGRYTSAGGTAPSNTVYLTEPNTVFAGGLEYERVAVGEGSICVLTTKGAPVYTVGDEGTFKFQDDGGTNFFGFAKTDSYVIGADFSGIVVGNDHVVQLSFDITMSGVPCIWYKSTLDNYSQTMWEQLNLPDGTSIPGASHLVTWEQNPPAGKEICYINVGNEPSGFFRATVEVAGQAKFITNMPSDLAGGILCTDGVHKVSIDWNGGNPRFVEVQ